MGFQKVAKVEDLWSGEMMGLEVNGDFLCKGRTPWNRLGRR